MPRDGRGGGGGGGGVTVASADDRPGPAHLGQGARKATCTLRRCRNTRTSSRATSRARAVALSPTRGYRCRGGCGGDPGAGNTACHTAYTLGIEAGTAPATAYTGQGRGEGLVAPGEAPDGADVGDTHPMAPGFLITPPPQIPTWHRGVVVGSARGWTPPRPGLGSPTVRAAPGQPSRQDLQDCAASVGHDPAPPGRCVPRHTTSSLP